MERVLIKPPSSRVGTLSDEERRLLIQSDGVGAKYDQQIDRESAQELLAEKLERAAAELDATEQAKAGVKAEREELRLERERERLEAQRRREEQREMARREREAARPSMSDKLLQSAGRAAASSIGRQIGNQLLRGIFGGLLRGR